MDDNARYVVVFPPDHAPQILRCDDGDGMQLKTLQNLVGGPIETIPAYDTARCYDEPELPTVLIVNEEALLQEPLPAFNWSAWLASPIDVLIRGNAILMQVRGDEWIGFTASDAESLAYDLADPNYIGEGD